MQFTSDGQNLGPAVLLDADGTASQSTKALTAGVHQIEALFTPADSSRFLTSSAQLQQFVGLYT